jgi:hypothetical protein
LKDWWCFDEKACSIFLLRLRDSVITKPWTCWSKPWKNFGNNIVMATISKVPQANRLRRKVILICGMHHPPGVMPLGNPLEAANALACRNGLPIQVSLLVWLRHALEAQYHSRLLPRVFLEYQMLVADWRATLETSSPVDYVRLAKAMFRHGGISHDRWTSRVATRPLHS